MSSETSPGGSNLRQALERASGHFTNLVELGILKTFIDHKIFDLLPDSGDPISISDLAAQVPGADPALLERFVDFLVASEILSSPAPGRIAHTERSRAYRYGEVPMGFVVHVYNFLLRPVACWTAFFEQNGLAAPKQAGVNPLGMATGHENLDLYGILAVEPTLARLFNAVMAGSAGIYSLKGAYDFGWVARALAAAQGDRNSTSETGVRPVIVDVGGGGGGGLRGILADNPFIPPARCAVLDLPSVLEAQGQQPEQQHQNGNGGNGDEIQRVPGSMFEALPGPVRSALVYHVRRVFNDFPDGAVVSALGRLREAALSDSRVLVVEELLYPGRTRFSAAQDIFLMGFGGKRRSREMFGELAAKAGFALGEGGSGSGTDFGVVELVPV